jgi:integrase
MSIRKIKLNTGDVYEVDLYSDGRGSSRIRRRFKKKIDAHAFIQNYQAETLQFKRTGQSLNLLEEVRFEDEANFWLESSRHHFSPAHLKRVEGILKEIFPRFGHLTLDHFTASYLTMFQKELKSRRQSNSTVNRKIEVITAILNHSVRNRRIPYNPAVGFKKLSGAKEEISFWEQKEAQSFLSFMEARYPLNSAKRWIYVAYLTALNTGLRAGEIWGLKPIDLVEGGDTLFIRRQFNRVTRDFDLIKGKRNSKSRSLSRHVPCNEYLRDEVLNLINQNQIQNDETIFMTLARTPVDHDKFQKIFKADLKAWGGKVIRFHDMRHTATTLLIASGVDLKTVQSICGHEDIKTTMNYVHLIGDRIKEVAKNFSIRPENQTPKKALTEISSSTSGQ